MANFCAEILEVGKIFFAASSVKKMSRFEEVSPEEIKRIVDNATSINTKRPESGVLVQHNQFQHLQSSANSTAFIARGGQIFPRPQYNFSNCNVQFTTTAASPAEQLIADIVTLFVRSKL